MTIQLPILFQIILFSSIVGLILAYLSLQIAPKFGLMDDPKSAEHKVHEAPIPLTGGTVILLVIWIATFFFDLSGENPIKGIILASSIIYIFGLWDDLEHLTPTIKLIGQFFGALLLIQNGVQIHLFDSPEFFIQPGAPWDVILNISLTVFWVIAIVNAFNLIDSFDGLAVGLSALSASFFLVISIASGQREMAYFSAIILGGTFAVYFYNSHPAKLFLGDSGAQTLGFILASMAILYRPNAESQLSSWFVPILVFGVPLFDLCLVFFSRLRRRKKVHSASKDHTYHRLAQRGVDLDRAVLLMHGVSLILSVVGYLCLNLPAFLANSIFLILMSIAVSAFFILDKNYE